MVYPFYFVQIKMLNADKAGVVFDGRNIEMDEDAQFDTSSIGISFFGFESELCGIVGYKFGLGNIAGQNDILAYTGVGVVMRSEDEGIAAVNIELPRNKKVLSSLTS